MLRRLVDEPAGVSTLDRDHVTACARCRANLSTIGDDARSVRAALTGEPSASIGAATVDVDAAWRRLSGAPPEVSHGVTTPRRPHRLRTAARRPVVAAVAVAVVLAGAGTAAANGWLPIFRTERVAPLELSKADLRAVPDLDAYGDLDITGEPGVHTVPDAAVAAEETGLNVPEVLDLPRGVSGEPRYEVGGELRATFTFSTERARRTADEADQTLPTPPSGLDGSAVRLIAGPGVAAIWSQSSGLPELVVGRAVAPTGASSGVAFETVRDYLLSLPGLAEDTAAALRAFNADGTTLPLPVPADRVRTSTARVRGVQATVLETRDRSAAAVVWVEQGIITLVGGTLDADEVLSVARGLR
jgi:hypothetical protein